MEPRLYSLIPLHGMHREDYTVITLAIDTEDSFLTGKAAAAGV
jgi:hypothetical protein